MRSLIYLSFLFLLALFCLAFPLPLGPALLITLWFLVQFARLRLALVKVPPVSPGGMVLGVTPGLVKGGL